MNPLIYKGNYGEIFGTVLNMRQNFRLRLIPNRFILAAHCIKR
jgi:hypothetical protein